MIENLKPYPKMKDSGVPWLGDVPGHWSVLPGRACLREKKVSNTGMQETSVLSLSYGQIVVKPAEKLHGLVPASFETYQIIEPGDIVVRPTDLQNDWNSLRFGLSAHHGIITSAYICLRTMKDLRQEYGHLLLHTYDLKKIFYGLGSGLRQNLDWRDFKYLPCLHPSSAEQSAIIRFLDYMDRRIRRYIRAKQKLIKLLEEQKQAIIHRAVTGQIDVRNGQPYPVYRPSGVEWLGDVPKEWSLVQVRRVVSFVTSGSRGWAKFYSDTGDIFLQSGNLGRSMSLNMSFVQRVETPQGAEGERTRVQRDDVLVCVTGALTGNVAHVDVELPGPAFVNQHVALVRPNQRIVYPRYLAYILHSEIGRTQFKTSEYGGTKQGLGLNDVKSCLLPLPTMSEQIAISSDLDEKTAGVAMAMKCAERQIFLLREYRTRLIADVVTGKLDVREAAARLPEEAGETDLVEETDALTREEGEDAQDSEAAAKEAEA